MEVHAAGLGDSGSAVIVAAFTAERRWKLGAGMRKAATLGRPSLASLGGFFNSMARPKVGTAGARMRSGLRADVRAELQAPRPDIEHLIDQEEMHKTYMRRQFLCFGSMIIPV
ncbi:hypothetical protein M440DRAFT_1091753 [Trichoderma longibrachiatum ATCC 18648]|uniref:Uncharacterized protein n=1 Tax=Trichoderma longibrachiatum ATCC 18648 TaxID=983965 RepID=A0A2T4BT97_TRILO|nr:hypothetical protein M440DRAFT_1091753 [Trichoderma longibrachiatum ATCC 18648]